jgi:hypothetical protein
MLLFTSFVIDPVSRLNQLECKINAWKQNVEKEKFEDAKGFIRSRKSKMPKVSSEVVNLRW